MVHNLRDTMQYHQAGFSKKLSRDLKILFLSLALIAPLITTGCSLMPPPPSIWVDTASFNVDPDANNTSATAVDLVVVYFNEDVFKKLAKMKATEYFKQADQLKRDNPGMIDIFRWEVVPGQLIIDDPVDFSGWCPVGALVFANYMSPGDHRVRVGADRDLHIHLKRNDFCLSSN